MKKSMIVVTSALGAFMIVAVAFILFVNSIV
jgi:hypothetical protein